MLKIPVFSDIGSSILTDAFLWGNLTIVYDKPNDTSMTIPEYDPFHWLFAVLVLPNAIFSDHLAIVHSYSNDTSMTI